jgi:hypothetical protein
MPDPSSGCRAAGLLPAAFLFISACGSSGSSNTAPTGTVTSITVAADSMQGDSLTLAPGDSELVTATALDAQGNPVSDVNFLWTSSNPSVATVSATGLLAALDLGEADIDVSAEGQPGSSARQRPLRSNGLADEAAVFAGGKKRFKVTVDPKPVISPSAASTDVGGTVAFTFALVDAKGNHRWGDAFAQWSSSDPSVATVDPLGVATGVSRGTTTIIATATTVPSGHLGPPLSNSAQLVVGACGSITKVTSWDATIDARYSPGDVSRTSSIFHIDQHSSATASLVQGSADSNVSVWQGVPRGTASINNSWTMSSGGTAAVEKASNASLLPDGIFQLRVTDLGSGCRYELEYGDRTTYQLTLGQTSPAPETTVLGVTFVESPVPSSPPAGTPWTLTGNLDVPAQLPDPVLTSLVSRYEVGTYVPSVLLISHTNGTAHVNYTLQAR